MRPQLVEEVFLAIDPEPPDSATFLRANPGAQELLKQLAEESRLVMFDSVELEPAAYNLTVGERLSAEIEKTTRRERQLRDLRALASCRVSDLKPDQVRRILEAIR